jgi:hypothetical protein
MGASGDARLASKDADKVLLADGLSILRSHHAPDVAGLLRLAASVAPAPPHLVRFLFRAREEAASARGTFPA